MELFGLGWNLAMQEHVPDEMLSRAYSYDALGSFVAIPIGQLAASARSRVAFGIRETIAGLPASSTCVICLATLGSRSVRDLQRAGGRADRQLISDGDVGPVVDQLPVDARERRRVDDVVGGDPVDEELADLDLLVVDHGRGRRRAGNPPPPDWR